MISDNKNKLSDRKKLILKAIVDAHIANGDPVGSKLLTRNELISCSSATIRNEMAELESMGYLEQPHTSAGRIPSEAGYRFYVDWLLDRYSLTRAEIDELKNGLQKKQSELDSIMQSALAVAAKLTNYTAISVRPKIEKITVSRYELMRLDDYSSMLIMLVGGVVKTKYLRSNTVISSEATHALAMILNMYAVGLTASDFTMPLIMEMEQHMGNYDFLVSPVVKAICMTLSEFDGGDLKIEGVNKLLSYPEFYNLERLREMLMLFEKKDDLLEIFSGKPTEPEKVQVYIGKENLVKVMDNSTLIFKAITNDGKTVGAIGVIGPTRMDYKRVIATIDNVANGVSAALESNNSKKDI